MRLHLAAVLAASSALLPGCFGSATPADLAELQNVSIDVDTQPASVVVSLDYAGDLHNEDDCKAISVTATYNGVGATAIAAGRWMQATIDAPAYCEHPAFFFDRQDVESATIEIADHSKTITVDIPHLLAVRSVAFAAPVPTALQDGDVVTFTAQLAPGDIPSFVGGTAKATAPGCDGPSDDVFDNNTTETADRASFTVSASLVCKDALPAGTPVALDLEVTETVQASVATCDGATACVAGAVSTTELHSVWNP